MSVKSGWQRKRSSKSLIANKFLRFDTNTQYILVDAHRSIPRLPIWELLRSPPFLLICLCGFRFLSFSLCTTFAGNLRYAKSYGKSYGPSSSDVDPVFLLYGLP